MAHDPHLAFTPQVPANERPVSRDRQRVNVVGKQRQGCHSLAMLLQVAHLLSRYRFEQRVHRNKPIKIVTFHISCVLSMLRAHRRGKNGRRSRLNTVDQRRMPESTSYISSQADHLPAPRTGTLRTRSLDRSSHTRSSPSIPPVTKKRSL